MNYQLIVFDLAGTTVKDNRDVHRVLQSAMRKHGVEISMKDANDVMGIPKPVAIHDLLMLRYSGVEPVTKEWVNKIHHDFVGEMVEFYKTDASVEEKPFVSDTFRKLKSKGLKIAVNTGFDRLITDALLARLEWRENQLIDYSVTSDEVKHGRPYPDMILKLMADAQVKEHKKVIKVGDTSSDVKEGQNAGCGMVVGVTSGAFTAEELERDEPDFLIHDVNEILDLIK